MHQCDMAAKERAADQSGDDAIKHKDSNEPPDIPPAAAKEIFARRFALRRVGIEHSGHAEQRHEEKEERKVHGGYGGAHGWTPFGTGDHLKVDTAIKAMEKSIGEQAVVESRMKATAKGRCTELGQSQVEQPEPEDIALVAGYDP